MQYVVCLVFDRLGQNILLVRKARTMFTGSFNGPGGKVEPDDASIYAAAARELQEETGLVLHPEDFTWTGTLNTPFDANNCGNEASVAFLSAVADIEQPLKAMPDEPAAWYPIDPILNLPVDSPFLAGHGDMQYFIRQGLANQEKIFAAHRDNDARPTCVGATLSIKPAFFVNGQHHPRIHTLTYLLPAKEGTRAKEVGIITGRREPFAYGEKARRSDRLAAFMLDASGQYALILQRYDYALGDMVFSIPAGYLLPNETQTDAIAHIVHENTGWGSGVNQLSNNRVMLPPTTALPDVCDIRTVTYVVKVSNPDVIPPSIMPEKSGKDEFCWPIWLTRKTMRDIIAGKSKNNITCSTDMLGPAYSWAFGVDFS